MRRLAIAALMLLGACGQKEQAGDATVAATEGRTDALMKDAMKFGGLDPSTSASSEQCKQRPDYVPLYPDAKVQVCLPMGKGGQIIYTTGASRDEIKDFYRKAAVAAKLDKSVSDQGNMFSANDGGTRRLTVMTGGDDNPPMIQIVYGDITG